jgi:hypothetical protein
MERKPPSNAVAVTAFVSRDENPPGFLSGIGFLNGKAFAK